MVRSLADRTFQLRRGGQVLEHGRLEEAEGARLRRQVPDDARPITAVGI